MYDALRKIFGGEKQDVRNLVKVAYAQGKIDELDVNYLNNELKYLHLSEREVRKSRNAEKELRQQLPKDPKKVYGLIYRLTEKLMATNMLTDKKESVLKRLVGVFAKNMNNVNELIHFLKYNIRYGKSIEDSYARLGYLLQST